MGCSQQAHQRSPEVSPIVESHPSVQNEFAQVGGNRMCGQRVQRRIHIGVYLFDHRPDGSGAGQERLDYLLFPFEPMADVFIDHTLRIINSRPMPRIEPPQRDLPETSQRGEVGHHVLNYNGRATHDVITREQDVAG